LLAHENAKRFSAEKAGWVYELSDWQGKKLTKTLNELIEDKAQPEESTESADPNS
jgi:UDP-N-acetylglucosamine:LPS N-acetylglucosamine transferase